MDILYLIARIAGQRVALPAGLVESVVEIESITPVPLAPVHILGLSALRSRTLTIVDSHLALDVEPAPRSGGPMEAVVVTVDGHLYGLLVDRVDDVATIPDAPRAVRVALDAGWGRAARGMLDHEGDDILLLDPATLIGGPLAFAAA